SWFFKSLPVLQHQLRLLLPAESDINASHEHAGARFRHRENLRVRPRSWRIDDHLARGRTIGGADLMVRRSARNHFSNCSDRGEYRPFHSVQWHLAKPKVVRLYQESRHPCRT